MCEAGIGNICCSLILRCSLILCCSLILSLCLCHFMSLYQPMDPPRSTSFYFFRPNMCYISLCYFWAKCVWGVLVPPYLHYHSSSPSYGPIIFLCKVPCVLLPDPILPHYLLSFTGLLTRIFRFYPNSFILFNLKKIQRELHNTFCIAREDLTLDQNPPLPANF